jgi:hypothetical protein
MKLFNVRNLLGLAAIGGAYAYARKHGGVKKTFDHLMQKRDELMQKMNEKKDEMIDRARDTTGADRAFSHVDAAATSVPSPSRDIPGAAPLPNGNLKDPWRR